MMKHTVLLLLSALFLVVIQSCSSDTQQSEPVVNDEPEVTTHDAFFDNLSSFCDAVFIGEATYPEESDHPLVGTELVNRISYCDDQKIRIELLRDTDYWHGAWVLEKRDEGFHLFHDHLGDARTEEDLGENDFHGYGGYADDRGSDLQQYFPADDVTAQMIPEAATNVWMMKLDPENQRFIYYLERHGEKRFQAELYLESMPD